MSDLIRKQQAGNDHVTPWLGAYLDGELDGALREQIEAHLENCAACREELESLEQLSDLLQSSPQPTSRTSDAAFARQVLERISQPETPLWQRVLRLSWRYAPLFFFVLWAFGQAVGWVAALLLNGLSWIPGGEDAFQALVPSATSLGSWLLGGLLSSGLIDPMVGQAAGQLAWLRPVGTMALINLALLAVVAVLFLSWLASWWAYHNSQPEQVRSTQ